MGERLYAITVDGVTVGYNLTPSEIGDFAEDYLMQGHETIEIGFDDIPAND